MGEKFDVQNPQPTKARREATGIKSKLTLAKGIIKKEKIYYNGPKKRIK